MIYAIIKSYLSILLSVGMGSILVFVTGLYCILKPRHVKPSSSTPIELDGISAIAGEDVLATQLDLARAYIETGKKQSAKKILEYVIKQGSAAQQDEAKELFGYI